MYTINKICELLEEKKVTQVDLMNYLGVNKGVFTHWKSGRSQSYNRYLVQIAEFFGVSVSELTGEEENVNAPVYLDDETRELVDALRKRPEMRTLFKVSRNASKEDVEMAVDIIERFKKGSADSD
jgi:transcriptional regulator with XRE-family HTH domain